MTIKTYTNTYNTRKTSQSEKIPGTNQVKNSAGGYSFAVDDWTRLERFLILGTEGGSYYASEKQLTLENAKVVERCVKSDGPRTIMTIVTVSDEGRAPKNDPAIFALAVCMKLGDENTRKMAQEAFGKVCRIGTHVFQAAEAVKALGGWGRGTKRAFTSWYTEKAENDLAYQLVKYQARNGWSHRDILRKLHITPKNRQFGNLFKWAVGKAPQLNSRSAIPDIVKAFEAAKLATTPKDVITLIQKYGLPRECVPTQFLNDRGVWEALLMSGKGMPIHAMIRNLGKMSEVGLLTGMNDATRFVTSQLQDEEVLKRARVHPLAILMALRTYSSGHGLRGSLTWKVSQNVADALDDAFYRSFKFVQPTGKRHFLALDVSGSMHGGQVGGTALTPAEAAVAMALVTMNVEKDTFLFGFGTRFQELPISKKDRLDRAVARIANMNFGGTDCSLPMKYAKDNKIDVDAFFVYTDSETWAGNQHPVQALREYRKFSGIPAKEVVVGMVSNGFTIADPNDAGMLDVVGFDTATPALMADFVRN